MIHVQLCSMQHCTNARFSFAATIDNMVEQLNRQPANGATSNHGKMARFEKTALLNICYDFQKGKCSRGDKCPYKHIIDPDYKTRSNNRKTSSYYCVIHCRPPHKGLPAR